MKKIIAIAASIVAVLGFSVPVFAAYTAVVPSSSFGSITGPDSMQAGVGFSDGVDPVVGHYFSVNYYSGAPWSSLRDALDTQIISYAAANGLGSIATSAIEYTGASIDGITSDATTLADGLMSASDKTSLNALISSAPQSYQTIISQSGTAAPTNLITPIDTYSGAPGMTWARTGTGVYTLTAGSAIFNTSGKTGIFVEPLANPVNNLVCVVTSSTVITCTSSSLGIISLLFGATAADSLVSKIMVYVQTYP